MRRIVLLFICICSVVLSFAQKLPEVEIPAFKDKYSDYVKKLEEGTLDIDYQDFRFSFLESEQFNVAGKRSKEFREFEEEMYKQMGKKNYDKIIKAAKAMLSIDYTNMMAHKILRQTYKIVGDTINAAKYKTIQFGLLNSIVKKGDGKSCATGWPVIQISEEYFILNMIGANLDKQSLDNTGGTCDKMDVTVERESRTYYFEVSKVFEQYKKTFK